MRKSSTKKISGKSDNKATEEKIKTATGTPRKTIANTRKKEVKKVQSKNPEKKRAKSELKVGTRTALKANKKSAGIPSKDKEKEKTRKASGKPAPGRKGKVPPTALKKVTAGKKVATKPVKKAKVEVEKKIRKKPVGTVSKIAAPVKKKVPVRKAEDAEIKKPAEKRERKKYARETAKKLTKIPKKKIKGKISEKGFPGTAEESQPAPGEILPSEYGENDMTLMPVDPHRLFAFWEVREDTIGKYDGGLTIRLYDATGIDLDHVETGTYFDIAVSERIGRRYIDVRPEKEFVAAIGIIYESSFITISRSHKVTTPRAGPSQQDDSVQKPGDVGLPVGYETAT